jgi:hypothetical protein
MARIVSQEVLRMASPFGVEAYDGLASALGTEIGKEL